MTERVANLLKGLTLDSYRYGNSLRYVNRILIYDRRTFARLYTEFAALDEDDLKILSSMKTLQRLFNPFLSTLTLGEFHLQLLLLMILMLNV